MEMEHKVGFYVGATGIAPISKTGAGSSASKPSYEIPVLKFKAFPSRPIMDFLRYWAVQAKSSSVGSGDYLTHKGSLPKTLSVEQPSVRICPCFEEREVSLIR